MLQLKERFTPLLACFYISPLLCRLQRQLCCPWILPHQLLMMIKLQTKTKVCVASSEAVNSCIFLHDSVTLTRLLHETNLIRDFYRLVSVGRYNFLLRCNASFQFSLRHNRLWLNPLSPRCSPGYVFLSRPASQHHDGCFWRRRRLVVLSAL